MVPKVKHIERFGTGEIVLFLHGSGWNMRVWHNQKELTSSMEVVFIDLPGHGESEGPPCDSVAAYQESVYNTVLSHNLKGCFVVGHSLGGAIALSLAHSHPELIKGIVLVGTGAKLRVLPAILEQIASDHEKAVEFTAALAFSEHAAARLKEYAISETMKAGQQTMYSDFLACDGFDMRDTISLINTPSLVLCGSEDKLTPPKYAEFLHRSLSNAQLELVANAGHMLMLEKPLEINESIRNFVKEQVHPK